MPMSPKQDATEQIDPAQLRSVFGNNLRKLSARYASVASLCRELGINRTQFNRYLSAESFPRPDVLHRICVFFDVDARILLEPVEDYKDQPPSVFNHPFIAEFLSASGSDLPAREFPNGFYRFSRPSFSDSGQFILGVLHVTRDSGQTFVRAFEAKEAMLQQGLTSTTLEREIRGTVLRQEHGVAVLAARRGSTTFSFSFLSRVPSFQNNFWEGYAARTMSESINGPRVVRMVLEYLGTSVALALPAARTAGIRTQEDLPAYHARLLRIGMPFN